MLDNCIFVLISIVYYSHLRTACIYEIILNKNAMCNYLVYNIQQQNSLNLTSNNLEIEVQDWKFCFLFKKKHHL